MKLNSKDFTFSGSAFEDSDWIVSIHKNDEPVWKSIPIGKVLSSSEAKVVADWLNDGGLAMLWQIASNIMKDKMGNER